MRRVLAMVVLLVTSIGATAPPAAAGTATDVALGLAAFAVFSQLAHAAHRSRVPEHHVVYTHPAPGPARVLWSGKMITVIQPGMPTAQPPAVHYPHGRYELHGDGVATPYQWVWIPAVPPPPPPPPPPPAH
jgi:hypothetical protein